MIPIFTPLQNSDNKRYMQPIINNKMTDDYIKSREEFKNSLRKALGVEYNTKKYKQEYECSFILDEYDSISKDKNKA